jgi:ribulose-5-phosphate 4-epimerase/fuculose-1-phosphate aldolase
VDPEVLGLGLSGEQAETHLQALSRYRQVFDALGYGMAMQAYSLFPLVQSLQGELSESIALRARLRQQMQIPEATMVATTIKELVPQYAKLCEAMHGLANGGRTHWGDAIGVHRILEEAFAVKKGKP